MRRFLSCLIALTALSTVATAAPKISRKVTITAVEANRFLPIRVGRIVEGKITFAASLGGSPTGTPTQACGRVHVIAQKYTPSTDPNSFGASETVKDVTATPIDANDLSKGCKYSMSGLPHSVQLSVDAHYVPPTAWNPVCSGNIAQISTNKVLTLTLPNANTKVTLDQVLDYKYCGNLQ